MYKVDVSNFSVAMTINQEEQIPFAVLGTLYNSMDVPLKDGSVGYQELMDTHSLRQKLVEAHQVSAQEIELTKSEHTLLKQKLEVAIPKMNSANEALFRLMQRIMEAQEVADDGDGAEDS